MYPQLQFSTFNLQSIPKKTVSQATFRVLYFYAQLTCKHHEVGLVAVREGEPCRRAEHDDDRHARRDHAERVPEARRNRVHKRARGIVAHDLGEERGGDVDGNKRGSLAANGFACRRLF